MEPKGLLCLIFCLIILITDIKVQSMSTVNADFERYLRAMNSSTTVPNMDERMVIDSYILAVLNFSYVNNEDELVRFSEENARYGEGKVLNVQGLLVHVTSSMDRDDDKACKSDILGTNGNPFPTHRSWIALVRRGECTFEEKVKNVAFKGAVGIIVYNDKPVMNLEKMQIKDKNRNITAVMTLQEVGQRLGTIADQGFEVHAFITRGRSGVRPINTLNKTSVLFVSISFIVLMIISLVWLIFYYIHRLRYLQSKDQQSRHLCSVTKRAIMRIPTKTVKSNDKDGECDCCAICIEVYKSSDCIRVLPCKHEFHKNCIDPWLIEHRTCPMCKLDVLKYYGYVFIGSEECVMELEGSYFDNTSAEINMAPMDNNTSLPPVTGSVTLQIEHWETRLRNFNIIQSPQLYHHRLPERSQSSLSFINNNQLACSMTNKLGAQHGIVRKVRKLSRTEDTMTLAESLKRRRSHSAESRFSQNCSTRRGDCDKIELNKNNTPSSSRERLNHDLSLPAPIAEVKIQINGEGVEI